MIINKYEIRCALHDDLLCSLCLGLCEQNGRASPTVKQKVHGFKYVRFLIHTQYNKIFQAVWGKTGLELANEWEALEQRLAVPSCEFAIIAGGKGEPSGSNPLLRGDDDFVVSVEETRLPGDSDFRMLPVLHSSIMDDTKVRECALRFFGRGYLVSADERQPIARDPAHGRPRE